MSHTLPANVLPLSEEGANSLAIAVADGIRRAQADITSMLARARDCEATGVNLNYANPGSGDASTRAADDWRQRARVAGDHLDRLEQLQETLAEIPGGDVDRLYL